MFPDSDRRSTETEQRSHCLADCSRWWVMWPVANVVNITMTKLNVISNIQQCKVCMTVKCKLYYNARHHLVISLCKKFCENARQVHCYLLQLKWQHITSSKFTQQMGTFKTIFQLCLSTSWKNPMERSSSTKHMFTHQWMTTTQHDNKKWRNISKTSDINWITQFKMQITQKDNIQLNSKWISQVNTSWTPSVNNNTTTTILWPSYRSTCVSWHLELRTRGFCWYKILLPACPCRRQPAHLG